MLTIYVVKPFTQRRISFLLAVVCGLSCLPLRSIAAQEKLPAKKQSDTVARYDFSAYAAELAIKVGHEAAGLSPVDEKIETELEAARILAPVRPSDALQLLDAAWSNINEWVNDKKSPDARRRSYLVSKLRGDVLALYAKLDAKERQTDLAAAAVADISDAEIKSILQDYILMIQIEKLSKEKNYATAEDKAAAIMKPEWRAWTLMALGSGQPEQNRSAIIRLYNAAQDALGKSQPTPRRAELAFTLADLWSGYDTNRAFEVIGLAVKYANQVIESDRQIEPLPVYLQGLFVSIGNLNFAGGLEAGSLSEVEFQPGIERLARLNWLVADDAGRSIQNMNLRLRYQLAICKGTLSARKADKKISRHLSTRNCSANFIKSGASA